MAQYVFASIMIVNRLIKGLSDLYLDAKKYFKSQSRLQERENSQIADTQKALHRGFETQHQSILKLRLLKTILNKKLKNVFYFNLDINDYKKQKLEYLKNMAKNLADQVVLTKEEKILLPMSSYERRIIHAELAQRTDVITESQGEGFDRHIVIKLK